MQSMDRSGATATPARQGRLLAAITALTFVAVLVSGLSPAGARDAKPANDVRYAELTDRQAWSLARQHLPEVLEPLGTPVVRGRSAAARRGVPAPTLKLGEAEFIGRFAARVRQEGRDGKPQTVLVESSTPLRAPGEDGELRPIDLTLKADKVGDLRPRFAGAGVRLSSSLARDSMLEDVGLRVRPLVPRARRATARAARRAFFANADASTDVSLTPQPGGLEASWLLRSRRSPEHVSMRLSSSARVKVAPRRGGGFVIRRGGKKLAFVHAAVAWDAKGRSVRVIPEVTGSTLVYRVEHRTANVRYPVTVDPVVETWDWAGTTTDFTDWNPPVAPPLGTTSATTGGSGAGLYLNYLGATGTTPANAEWNWKAPGTVSISNWYSGVVALQSNSTTTPTCATLGVRTAAGATTGNPVTSCGTSIPSKSFYGSNAAGDTAYFRHQPPSTVTSASALLRYARLDLTDSDNPTVGPLQTQGFTSGSWVGPNSGTVSVSAALSDTGLGASYFDILSSTSTPLVHVRHACTGTRTSRCPSTWSGVSWSPSLELRPAYMAEGFATWHPRAIDIVNRETRAPTFDLGVDRGAPKVTLSGGLNDDTVVGTAARSLTIAATDGPASTTVLADRRSGVKSISVLVDGVPQGTDATQSCAYGCPLSRTFSFDPTPWSTGNHTVRTIVTDQAGNVTTKDLLITVDRTAPTVTLGGPLTTAQQPLTKATYRLDVSAVDTPAARSAGIQRIEILHSDGATERLLDTSRQACDTDSCPMTFGWTLETAKVTSGTIIARAYDRLGLHSQATQAISVGTVVSETTAFSGLEEYMHYDVAETGAGSRAHVNMATGNLVWNVMPLVNPGRGVATFANVTYNAQRRAASSTFTPYDEIGEGFSLGISGLTRVNEPLDLSRSDTIGEIGMVDPDGTNHTFRRSADGTHYTPPPGVNLHLRRYSTSEDARSWAITRPDGVTFFFDRRGFQTLIVDRNDNVLRFEYEIVPIRDGASCPVWGMSTATWSSADCRQRLVGVTDAAGVMNARPNRSVRLAYTSAAGRIASLTDHGGRVLGFTYSAGRLTTMTQASGSAAERAFRFFYGANGLASVMDPRGAETAFTYRAGGYSWEPLAKWQVAALEMRNDAKHEYNYGQTPPTNTNASVRDSRGKTTHFELDPRGRPLEIRDANNSLSVLTWDGDNNVRRIVEASGTVDEAQTDMDYNENGLLVKVTDGELNRTDLGYRDGQGRFAAELGETKLGFVSDLIAITTPEGTATGDPNDYTTKFFPDERGNVRQRTDQLGNSAYTDFDTYGQITSETDEVGNTTRYEQYDANGEAQVTTDPKEGRSEHRFDDVGNLLATADPRAERSGGLDDPAHRFQTRFEYDAQDQLRREILPKDSRAGQFITRNYDYDPNGNEMRSADGNGAETTQTFDEMDQVVARKSPPVDHVDEGEPVAEITRYEFDGEGNMVREEAPRGTEDASTGQDFSTGYEYDDVGQLVVVSRKTTPVQTYAGDMIRTSMAYDRRGNVIGITDPKGNARNPGGTPQQNVQNDYYRRFTFVYDDADRKKVSIEEPNGLNLRTEYAYDRNDNLTHITDPRAFKPNASGKNWTSIREYDQRDLLTAQIDPLGRRTQYDLRKDGLMEVTRSPRAFRDGAAEGEYQTRFVYDELGDLVEQHLPWGEFNTSGYSGQRRVWKYERDAVGNGIKVTDPRGKAYTSTFLDSGDVKTTTRPGMWEFAPDAGGREVTEKDWREIGNEAQEPELPSSEGEGDFGAVGQENMPELLPEAGATELRYDDEMRLTAVVDAAGATTTLERDDLGRMTKLRRPLDAAAGKYFEESMAYDRNGNLASATDGEGNVTRTRFDQFDRLVEREAPGSNAGGVERTTYAYDVNGQPLVVTNPRGFKEHRCYDRADRLISTTDAAGQMTSNGYDAAGNLETVLSPNGQAKDASPSDCTNIPTRTADYERWSTTTTFDPASQVVERREGAVAAGRVTKFGYDLDGNQTTVETPGTPAAPGAQPEARKTERVFDARNLPWKEIVGEGAHRRVKVTEYDGNGNLRREVNNAGLASSGDRPLHNMYGESGDLAPAQTRQDSPEDRVNGVVSSGSHHARLMEYDADNLLTTIHLPQNKDDSTEKRFRQTFHRDARGRVEKIDAPHEWTREPSVCSKARVDAPHVDPSKPSCIARTTYTRFDTGWIRSSAEPEGKHQTTGAPLGESHHYGYDMRGLQTSWRTFGGDGQERRVARRGYWPSGRLKDRFAQKTGDAGSTRVYDYRHSSSGSLTSVTDRGKQTDEGDVTDDRTYRIAYDAVDRRVATDEDPFTEPGRTKEGRDTLVTYDRNGNVTQRKTDGQLASTSQVSGGVLPSATPTYNNGTTSDYKFDEFDAEIESKITRANAPVQSFETKYFSSGDQQSRIEWHQAAGTPNPSKRVQEDYFYNNDGRKSLAQRKKADGSNAKDDQPYEYDKNGNRKTDEIGRHEFNARDQLTKWTRGTASPDAGKSVTYALNGSGDILSENDTSDSTITTNKYAAGRLVESNAVTSGDAANALNTTYGYDSTSGANVKSITSKRGAAAQPTSTNFDYDAFDRQTMQEVQRGTEDKDTTTYQFDGFDRRDRASEAFSRPAGFTGPVPTAKKAEFSYVGLSDSLSQREPLSGSAEKTTSFDYDSSMESLGQSSKTPTANPEEYRSYAKDANGSIEGLTQNDGKYAETPGTSQKARYAYDPYGNAEKAAGETAPGSNLTDDAKQAPFRFQGFYFDSGVKTYDMRARMYLPQAGRFLTQDRYESSSGDFNLVSDPLTQNRYAFAGGNPVSRIEFDGHFGFDDLKDAAKDVGKAAKDVGKEVVGDNPLEIGLTVASVAAAIPTGGASLAAGTAAKAALKTGGKAAAKSIAGNGTKKAVAQGGKSAASSQARGVGANASRGSGKAAGAGRERAAVSSSGRSGSSGAKSGSSGSSSSGRGGGCTSNSFTGDTPVLMADGSTRPIAAIRAGDVVSASDPRTGVTSARIVERLIVGTGLKPMVTVQIPGPDVQATAQHPFWVEGRDAWVDAEDLRAGDELRRPDGTVVEVESVRTWAMVGSVFNLTVEGVHTYYARGLLVHNCNPKRRTLKEEGQRIANDAGRNRIEAESPGGRRTAIDLAGKKHRNIDTPHVKQRRRHEGPDGRQSWRDETRDPTPATARDLRTARGIIKARRRAGNSTANPNPSGRGSQKKRRNNNNSNNNNGGS